MAKSPRTLISETKTSIGLIEQELESFIVTRDELNRQLSNARRRLHRKESDAYPNKLAQSIIQSIKKDASSILIEAIKTAATGSKEFSNPVYIFYMNQAAQDDTIYKMITNGSGWNIQFAPDIVFEASAGTLRDYAAGIESFRDAQKIKRNGENSSAGLRATNWWKTRVFGTGLETATIHERVKRSGRDAPFWQILNNGSSPLLSDRTDGSYNPFPQVPTDFIGNATRTMRVQFQTAFNPEKIKWLQETRDLLGFIEDTADKRDYISNQVRNLRIDAKLNRAIFNSFGELKKFVDAGKVEAALRRYRAGEEFERVLVSAQGAKRRVYLTAQRLEGLID